MLSCSNSLMNLLLIINKFCHFWDFNVVVVVVYGTNDDFFITLSWICFVLSSPVMAVLFVMFVFWYKRKSSLHLFIVAFVNLLSSLFIVAFANLLSLLSCVVDFHHCGFDENWSGHLELLIYRFFTSLR